MKISVAKTTLILAAAFLLSPISWPSRVIAQTPVRVAEVQSREMHSRHAVTGSLRAVARGDLAALEPGRLVQLTAREGETVRKGEILARIDARRLEAEKAQVEADLEIARAERDSRRAISERSAADLARATRLIQENAMSRQSLDSAKADARVSEADLTSAERRIDRLKQNLRLLDIRLSDMEIRAPYDATVVTRHVEPGDWVAAGETLLTLVSTGPIEAWLEVPERYVEALHSFGDQVVVRARATQTDAHVLSVRRVADVNPRVRTIHFIVTIKNERGLLAPGMSVDGWIVTSGNDRQLAVPHDAVIRRTRGAYVYRIDDQQRAEQVPVEVLFETTDAVAIRSTEIGPGDRVVVEGNERLMPGQSVAVAKDRPAVSLAKR